MRERFDTRRLSGAALLAACYFALACPVVLQWVGTPYDLAGEIEATFRPDGRLPASHRVLVPWLLITLRDATGVPYYQLACALHLVSLVLFSFAVRDLVIDEVPRAVASAAPVVCLPLLLWMGNSRTSHQFVALFLTAAALVAIRRSRWRVFAVLYVAGLLTRETAVLLVVPAVVAQRTAESSARLAFRVTLMLAAFFAVKTALSIWHIAPSYVVGGDAASGLFELPVAANVEYVRGLVTFRNPALSASWIAFIAFAVVVLRGWTRRKRFYRACVWHAAFVCAGMLVVARLDERRVLLETVPCLAALCAIKADDWRRKASASTRRLFRRDGARP